MKQIETRQRSTTPSLPAVQPTNPPTSSESLTGQTHNHNNAPTGHLQPLTGEALRRTSTQTPSFPQLGLSPPATRSAHSKSVVDACVDGCCEGGGLIFMSLMYLSTAWPSLPDSASLTSPSAQIASTRTSVVEAVLI